MPVWPPVITQCAAGLVSLRRPTGSVMHHRETVQILQEAKMRRVRGREGSTASGHYCGARPAQAAGLFSGPDVKAREVPSDHKYHTPQPAGKAHAVLHIALNFLAEPLFARSLRLNLKASRVEQSTCQERFLLQAGYYCSVCDCILRDSASYLDHINGKYHNRALGMSMRVERSTPDQVRLPGQAATIWLKLLTHLSMSEPEARALPL